MVLMASLARNTYYNISAFAINTILALATVTLLVRGYGIDGYGIIILARLLLPSGVMGLLEAGFPEVTSRSVAAAKADKDTSRIGQRVSAASIMAIIIGACAALVLVLLSDQIIHLIFHSAGPQQASMKGVVYVSALSLPLHLVGSVLRGAFEGDERFALVRFVEVVSNLSYLVVIAIMIFGTTTSYEAALAYVWVWNARSVLYILIILLGGGRNVSFGTRQIWTGNAPFLMHSFQLFSGKFFTLLLQFGPSIILGIFSNVGVVGSYEIVMRIPRLQKTISGMFNGALLPFAARSDALGDSQSARRIVEQGTTMVWGIIMVISLIVATFSAETLRFWLGITDPELAHYLQIALVWPVFISSMGIGSTMLMSRPSAAAAINRLSMATTVGYFVIAIGLYPFMNWKAFIVALVLSQAVTLPAYWRLQAREYHVNLAVWRLFFVKFLIVAAIVSSLSFILRAIAPVDNLLTLVLHASSVALLSGAGVYFFAVPTELRRANEQFLKSLVRL